jgi:hypothetical protein
VNLVKGHGCPNLKYLDLSQTKIQNPETIRFLLNSYPELSFLLVDQMKLPAFPDEIVLLLLRRLLKSILQDDRESISNAVWCLNFNLDLFVG